MHRLLQPNNFAPLVAPILLSVLAYKLLNNRRASAHRDAEDPNSGAPSPSTPQMESHYDVFLSFRGSDTRKAFTDYLYVSLAKAGIHTFRGENDICLDEEIGSQYLAAIRNSKILIPILSVNYGSSIWCLNELVQIMKCKNNNTGQIVLPIFYKIESDHVRHQAGGFGEAFRRYYRRRRFDQTVVKEWKQALTEVGSLKGWESETVANGHEGELVDLIVRKVLNELKTGAMLLYPTENLVGIDSHVGKIMELVNRSSSAALCVGIYGRDGIGKTTLAKVIYNKLFILFEHHSFIADIRESCNHKGIEYLQSKLIIDILGKSKRVHNKHDGIKFISSKFKDKKVLILLDDVDNTNQLEALVGNPNWFAPGSRIIVTTRDMSVLDRDGVDTKYQLQEMDEKQSLILFSRHAFREDSPLSEFYDLSRLVVSTIGGFPLDLEVVGSFLCGKTRAVWADEVEKMQNSTCQAMRDSLWMNYEALEDSTKQIFLDIACFLNGSDARVASYMWDACDFHPRAGIEELRSLSFIKIGDNHELIMHKEMRNLGREIVREENYFEPHKRSRLWDYEEALRVLKRNKGIANIEALCLDKGNSSRIAEEDNSDDINDQRSHVFPDERFRNLPNLRLLHMSDVNITGDCNEIFSELRWLKWGNCPRTFAAKNFHVSELVILDLSGSLISDKWEGWKLIKSAENLKVLNLTGCSSLESTSFLSDFKNLEFLILRNCDKLEEIESSIGHLKTVVSLDLSGCSRLQKLPEEVGNLEELKELFLDRTKIQEIPSFIGSLKKLEMLSARECELLRRLPDSICGLLNLSTLALSGCIELAALPDDIGFLVNLQCLSLGRCHKLRRIPNSIGELKLLSQLNLSGCLCLKELPPQMGKLEQLKKLLLDQTMIREIPSSISSLQKLEMLSAEDCKLLRRLPDSMHYMVNLSTLVLSGCVELAALPDSIGALVNLRCLSLGRCHRLREIPNSIGGLKLLTQLDLSGCSSLQELPPRMGKLEQLKELLLDQTMIRQIPSSIGSLKNLEKLSANDCKLLHRLPDSIGHLVNLSTLVLSGCVELVALQDCIGLLVNLRCLSLGRCHRLRKIPNLIMKFKLLTKLDLSGCSCLEELPPQMGKLEQLKELLLDQTMIREIPSSIGSLTNLETLRAKDCKLLRRLPDSIGHLENLSTLDLSGCVELAALPDNIGFLANLQCLSLGRCHRLREIPNSIGELKLLTQLDLSCTSITKLPESIGDLLNLEVPNIDHSRIEKLPDGIGV